MDAMNRYPLFLRVVRVVLAVGLIATATARVAAQSAPQAAKPATAHRVVLISIDGLRPDVMLRANTPNLRGLMREGSFTCYAQTTKLANTMPSHTSMITGLSPEKHGMTWNGDAATYDAVKLDAPTLFTLAKSAGVESALVSGKSKFVLFARDGSPTWTDISPGPTLSDAAVAEMAVAMIKANRPQFLMVHFPHVDTVGHGIGWGTKEQLAAVEQADAAVGRVLDALGADRAKTLVIISADHGGAGRGHSPDDFRAKFIPWIAAGPGVRKDYDLTLTAELTVTTEDTFATICDFLKLATPAGIDGKLVSQAFEPRPLATTTTPAVLSK